jgi:peroxiredoxin
MTPFVYNLITMTLAVGVLLAVALLCASLVGIIARWKSPQRGGHVKRLLIALATIPGLIAIQQAILWLVFLPAFGRAQMAKFNSAREQRLSDTSLVGLGDVAPKFSLTTIDGKELAVPKPGELLLINFFATWCGPCLMELPHIEKLWMENRERRRFRLVVIGREESRESVRDFREKHGYTFPLAADPDRAIYSLFATELIPRTMVVSPTGEIIYFNAGFREEDLNELSRVLREELSRRE